MENNIKKTESVLGIFPRISVIVPIYNVFEYLTRCIESLLKQTYKNLEIILVDDGSTDRSSSICEEYAFKDSRVRVFHKQNGGLSDARNFGIKIATGDYYAFVDGDDFIHPQMYEILYNIIKRSKCKVAACDFDAVTNIDIKPDILFDYFDDFKIISKNTSVINPEMVKVVAWNKLYEKSIFENLLYPEGKLHEDEFVFHKIMWACDTGIAITNKKLYHYLQRPSSIMASLNRKRIEDTLEAFEDRFVFAINKKWKIVLPELKENYLNYCVNYYFCIKNKTLHICDDDCLSLLYNSEKKMVQNNSKIRVEKKYLVFAKNPAEYERKFYNKRRTFLNRLIHRINILKRQIMFLLSDIIS